MAPAFDCQLLVKLELMRAIHDSEDFPICFWLDNEVWSGESIQQIGCGARKLIFWFAWEERQYLLLAKFVDKFLPVIGLIPNFLMRIHCGKTAEVVASLWWSGYNLEG